MEQITAAVICFILALISALISIRHFREKGFLFNNAYIWASDKEREELDKKPYYRQSAIVFAMISALFLSVGAECLIDSDKMWLLTGALLVAIVVYAIVSSVKMNNI